MCELGNAYANGTWGLTKDEAKAVEWYQKAAEVGEEYAMCKLGDAYANGTWGLTKDEAKAVEWYRKAAKGGYHKAAERLQELEEKSS